MKKSIIICVTCIAVAGLSAEAQNKTTTVTQETQSFIAPPPPPPPVPPIPPAPPAPSSTDEVDLAAPPPPPPVPPIPPTPPVPAAEDFAYVCPGPVAIEIINSNGYEISVHFNNGKEMVIVKKDGKTQKIKLSTWNANRKYYEKKYGQLPPPPPPIPMDGQVEFIRPVIEKIG